ncbi:hypothetical protein COO60DRAFT_665719 [Scenedesmus sp. NREL 46B-D3]|nr:hypothetical protein COO60DRAFT_665719 [Scenedesmus sp. NREL 46B-D3]
MNWPTAHLFWQGCGATASLFYCLFFLYCGILATALAAAAAVAPAASLVAAACLDGAGRGALRVCCLPRPRSPTCTKAAPAGLPCTAALVLFAPFMARLGRRVAAMLSVHCTCTLCCFEWCWPPWPCSELMEAAKQWCGGVMSDQV